MTFSQFTRLVPRKFLPTIGQIHSSETNLPSWFLIIAIQHSSRINSDFTGMPGKWIQRRLLVTLEKDVGLRYVDENASWYPNFPLEPLFRAIYTIKPDYDPKQVDLVTDRNNLWKPMQVICGTRLTDFHIDIELVGNTLLFKRWEKFDKEYVMPSEFKGFGKFYE